MKYLLLSLFVATSALNAMGQTNTVVAQNTTSYNNETIEKEIRKLEQDQVDYLLRGDLDAMENNWDADHTVNNPFNQIVKASEGTIRQGLLTYSSFVRDVQKVIIHGNTVLVMGTESVVPKGNSPDAGKTIQRRFTNVWMKKNDKWLMIGRHANT
ncbi:MAG: nuclear transport factor 2 family protein, partial [Haliscomenobacter sp.]|uniref:nuclear transport factor 2 family protein n=1 Tax=Haliscomenobacter sp. TaxID=2717303 RepID=UPI0029A217DC